MAVLNQLKEGIEQALGSFSEGWRELSQRATGALTRFKPGSATSDQGGASLDDLPR